MHSIWKLYKPLLCTLLIIFISGCEKRDPNPELRDPIYRDLIKTQKDYSTRLAGANALLVQANRDLERASARSLSRKAATRTISKTKKIIAKLTQASKYYEIRAKRRFVEARRSYKASLINRTSWPNPDEYRAYQANKSLREAPLNWNMRVPKLFKKSPNYTPAHKIKNKEAEEI